MLLECEIGSLPVDLKRVCQKEGIRLLSYQEAGEGLVRLYTDGDTLPDGVSFSYEGQDFILYNSDILPERQRYTIAHEIGHCVLDHFALYESGSPYDPEALEEQAERFAIQLLAPCCVLWALGLDSWQSIASLCRISRAAAERRLERLSALRRMEQTGKRPFLSHRLEAMVYQQFAGFIRSHGSC